DLVPLPLEDLQVVVGPRARYPVRVPRAVVVAGTARERHHDRHLEYLREAHRLLPGRAVALTEPGIRMHRVPVLAEPADDEAARLDRVPIRLRLLSVGEQLVRLAVRVSRIVARAELHRVESQLDHLVEHLLERQVAVQDGEHAQLHIDTSLTMSSTSTHTPVASDRSTASTTACT